METFRLGIDIDGTITAQDAFLPYINESFNLQLTLDDITVYDFSELLQMDSTVFWQWMDKFEPLIYAGSPEMDGALTALQSLTDRCHFAYITARRAHLQDVTATWLAEHHFPCDDLIMTGSHNKVAAVKEANVQLFFEDNYNNAQQIHEQCGIPVILFDAPYNQGPLADGVHRVYSWTEALDWVEHYRTAVTTQS